MSTCMVGKPWTSLFFLRICNSTRIPSVSHVDGGCAGRPVLGTEERLRLKIKTNLAAWSACRLNALAYINQTRVHSAFRKATATADREPPTCHRVPGTSPTTSPLPHSL